MEVKVSKIRYAGLGVFATRDYKKNELIERSGFLLLDNCPEALVSFSFDSEKKSMIYFGKMTLVNHAKLENVRYEECNLCRRIMEFYTTRKIVKGEEFFLDYGVNDDHWKED